MNNELLIKNLKSNNSEFKSNNEEKQIIEEMAEILKAYTKKNNIMASHVILECYAEELYSKNYRKQSEGEWIEDTEYYADDYSECNVRKVFSCSRCGRTEKRKEPYCNCGAKMKGGEQG